MKRAPTNIAASIHQRLLNLARASNRPFNELLQYFAIERFLYRFSLSPYKEQFVLKGAQMLRAWESPLARPTMDIDMLGGQTANTIENLERIVRECCAIEASDGVLFDTASVRGEAINKDAEYQGVRIMVRGTLGKIKLNVQIDFGFGDVVSQNQCRQSCRNCSIWARPAFWVTRRRAPSPRSSRRWSRSTSPTRGLRTSMISGL